MSFKSRYVSFFFLGYFGVALLCVFFLSSCKNKPSPATILSQNRAVSGFDTTKPFNVILLIGDGMALSQISAQVYWSVESSWMELFPVVGFHKSTSSDNLVTDSAAGATAFSCGIKTKNTYIGVDSLKKPCQLISRDFKSMGYAVGVVATSSATHATPASFLAHADNRAFTEDIASHYLSGDLDCIVAGGETTFKQPVKGVVPYNELSKMGFVLGRGTSFDKMPMDGSAPFALFVSQEEPPSALEGRKYLPIATREVCDYLEKRSKKGFFLMVEGSQIDWACHANDAPMLKAEMQDFDLAVGEAMLFAARQGNTLVLVTGDHECGGFALNMGSKKHFKPAFSTKLHTAGMVPVLAFGPGAELFQGIYENVDIHAKILAAMK